MNLLPVASKLPRILMSAYRSAADRKVMEDILRGALARAICANDTSHPAVRKLAWTVHDRMWEGSRDDGKPRKPLARMSDWARRKLRKADPKIVSWLRWREELKAWVRRHLSERELRDTLLLANCTFDGPDSLETLLDRLPEAFIEELNADAAPLRLKLRDVSRADEERRKFVLRRAVMRHGQEIVAAALGGSGALELAHQVDLDAASQGSLGVVGAVIAAYLMRRSTQSRQRVKLREAGSEWMRRTVQSLEHSPEQRAGVLDDLRQRLIVRAGRLGDEELVDALQDAEDALVRFELDGQRQHVFVCVLKLASVLGVDPPKP
jgi:hypothetical protein